MKFLTLAVAALFMCTGVALADDFGARFGDNAPAALQDTISPAMIEPAAGEETPVSESAPSVGLGDTPTTEQPAAVYGPFLPGTAPEETKNLLP